CVVPTFEVGRKAGLGITVTATELKELLPAWLPDAPEVELPVYYSCQFTTGDAGDFESLVNPLKPRAVPNTVGSRPLDVSDPGFGLPQTPGAVLPMPGILQPLQPPNAPPITVPAPLQTALARILNAPADALSVPTTTDPIVAPPIYGAPYPPKD